MGGLGWEVRQVALKYTTVTLAYLEPWNIQDLKNIQNPVKHI